MGDFLFVSKYHYGARVPKTVISFPMVHDNIVATGVRSYLNKPQLPYLRLPKIQKIKRFTIGINNNMTHHHGLLIIFIKTKLL